jgi:aminoglycoside phosphotransferase (APT) family kinase protein
MTKPLIQIDGVIREMTQTECADFLSRQRTTRTRADVLADLAAIDTRSIRALREGNATRIAELESHAVALRAELAAL